MIRMFGTPTRYCARPRGFAYLASLGKSLGYFAVTAPVAGGDEVSDSAALQEGGGSDGALAEDFGKGNHLHEAQADHGCFGVISKAQPIAETGPDSHHILRERKERICWLAARLRCRLNPGLDVANDCLHGKLTDKLGLSPWNPAASSLHFAG